MLTVATVTGQLATGYADYPEGKTTAPELGGPHRRRPGSISASCVGYKPAEARRSDSLPRRRIARA